MSSNAGILADEDGDFGDWIEIFNKSSQTVSLAGYGLSDQSSQPFKWVFPDIELNPNEYLVVFASGKDRKKIVRQHNPDWFLQFAPIAAYWSFDEGTGNIVFDDSGNEHHGTLQGPKRLQWNIFGGVLQFNRAEYDRVVVPDAAGLQQTGNITISMWVNPASFSGGMNVWDKSYDAEGAITVRPFGNMTYYCGNGIDFHGVHTINPLPLNQWTHIALVRNVEEMTVRWYQNGKQVAANLLQHFPSSSSKDLEIGRGYAGAFDGMIAKPLLLPYAANETQVMNLYLSFAGNLHTNFSISQDGESVFLTNPEGTIIDQAPPWPLLTDVSMGRTQSDPTVWRYFSNPTPAAPNVKESFDEILSPPQFSHQGGYYSSGFELMLSHSDPETTILYSLDGSTPEVQNISGKTYPFKRQYPQQPGQPFGQMLENTYFSHPYQSSIPINDVTNNPDKLSQISTTVDYEPNYFPLTPSLKEVVVRARATKYGAIPSETVTNTYILSENSASVYQFPVLSLSMDEDKLFDYHKGVYVAGVTFDNWRQQNPDLNIYDWEKPANYFRSGDAWEQTTHMEYFVPEYNYSVVNQSIRFRLHGSSSRYYPAKSFRFYAKGKYGPDNFLFPFFNNLPHTNFKRLMLRNSGQDWPLTLFRDAATQRILSSLRFDTQSSQAIQLLINGEYWGIHHLRERYDKYYLQRHYGVDPENIDMLELKDDVLEGDALHYYSLIKHINDNDLSLPESFETVKSMVDTENFTDYFISQIFIRNTDWPGNNITFWRLRTQSFLPDAPYGHDGRWRWMLFDTDFGLGMDGSYQAYMDNSIEYATQIDGPGWPNPPWSTLLLRSFLQNTEFRNSFINRFADLLNTIFLPSYTTGVIEEFETAFQDVMPLHISRWNSPGSMAQWYDNIYKMKNFAQMRPAFQRQHIRDFFGISHDVSININVSDEQHGAVRVNSIRICRETEGVSADPYPWHGLYFSGIPFECEAVAKAGYAFSHWEGDLYATEAKISITTEQEVNITAVFVASHDPEPEIIHYWHCNNLQGGTLTEVFADYTTTGIDPGRIYYAGSGSGYMDRRTHTAADPVSNLNLLMGQQANQGAVLRVRNPSADRELIFETSTKGFKEVYLTYATVRTNNGATNQSVYWSPDGGINWTELNTAFSVYPLPGWILKTFDLKSFNDASDNPLLRFKVLFSGDNASLSEGNNRFDNISLHGIPLPDFNISFYPNQALQGSKVTLYISGENVDWINETPDISLQNAFDIQHRIMPDEVRASGEGQIEADFDITANDPGGLYNLMIGDVKLWNAFTVVWVPFIAGQKEVSVQLFPNPVSDVVYVHTDIEALVSIYSMDGMLVASKLTANHKVSFDVKLFKKGVYFVITGSKDNRSTIKKLIVY